MSDTRAYYSPPGTTAVTTDDGGTFTPRAAPKPEPPKCRTCGLPVITYVDAVQHWGSSGATVEHQACWQSRTFGERHD